MPVMITGATGQVGRALHKAFKPVCPIIAVGREEFDLARPDRIASTLDRIAPDLIINSAAYTAVDRAEEEPDVAFRVNAEAPGAIARWAAARHVPLVHFSTDYVFDGAGGRPWREDDAANPLSVYGASKLAGEQAVRSAGGPHLIIRTSWIYAANARGNFLWTVARLAKDKQELRIVADQFGAPTSAWLIAETVEFMVRSGLEKVADQFAASGGLINVAASGETTWHGFATAITEGLKARGVPLAVENIVPIAAADYPAKARRPKNSRFDLTRLKEVFQIVPPQWQAMLAEELDQMAVEFAGLPGGR